MIEATAVAAEGCAYPTGEKHALLVFAAAPDRDAALERMGRGVAAHGWGGVEVMRSGEISSDADAIQDETLRASAKDAVEHGYSIVAYAEPMPTSSEQSSN